jgi:hypothetical protein
VEKYLNHNRVTTKLIAKATINEKPKARRFLCMVNFLPKYFISTGIVTIPTIIRVEIKAPKHPEEGPIILEMSSGFIIQLIIPLVK